MVDKFIVTYKRLLNNIEYRHHRYIYDDFNINNRLTGLIGPRGTGKTTLLLQFIKEKIKDKDECLYASIDNIYFSNNTLMEFVEDLYEDYGIRYFFLDEVHKYPGWNQAFKNIYDSYPDVKIVFSGSSSVDLVKGTYDLSRRAVIFRIGGMSFREYLQFNDIAYIKPITFEMLVGNRGEIEEQVAGIRRIKGYFKKYLECGYYPFFLEDPKSYSQKLLRVIEKTIYDDISNYYNLKTENLSSFKRIISYMATIPPGELNRNNIAKNIGMDNKTIQNYLNILKETGLIELVAENKSGTHLLRSTEKLYLDNPNLYKAIVEGIGYGSEIVTIREIFFIKMILNSGNRLYFSKIGDFEVNDNLFEIGGKNKSLKQIKNHLHNAFLVKDDILFGSKYEIPLYLFGFLY